MDYEPEPIHPLNNARFRVDFEYYWSQLAVGMTELASPNELATMHDIALQKDASFYDKVRAGADRAMTQAIGTVACLFDVDGTIADMKESATVRDIGDAEPIYMLVRPAFPEVVADLAVSYPEVLRFGLLSLRPADSLQAEAENPSFLRPVRPFIDDALIYSSKETARHDPMLGDTVSVEDTAAFLASMQGVIDPSILEATQKGEVDIFGWYDPKLRVIVTLHRANPDTTYVVVDNLAYADCLDPANPRLVGICVESEQQLLIPVFEKIPGSLMFGTGLGLNRYLMISVSISR